MYSFERRAVRFALRAAVFLASFVTSAVVVGSVGALFDHASRERMLRDTPQARTVLASCASQVLRQERQACVRQQVAQARARDAGLTRVANAASDVATTAGATAR